MVEIAAGVFLFWVFVRIVMAVGAYHIERFSIQVNVWSQMIRDAHRYDLKTFMYLTEAAHRERLGWGRFKTWRKRGEWVEAWNRANGVP